MWRGSKQYFTLGENRPNENEEMSLKSRSSTSSARERSWRVRADRRVPQRFHDPPNSSHIPHQVRRSSLPQLFSIRHLLVLADLGEVLEYPARLRGHVCVLQSQKRRSPAQSAGVISRHRPVLHAVKFEENTRTPARPVPHQSEDAFGMKDIYMLPWIQVQHDRGGSSTIPPRTRWGELRRSLMATQLRRRCSSTSARWRSP